LAESLAGAAGSQQPVAPGAEAGIPLEEPTKTIDAKEQVKREASVVPIPLHNSLARNRLETPLGSRSSVSKPF
jgi:hypothetical protein